MPLSFPHLVSAGQLTTDDIAKLFARADEFEPVWLSGGRPNTLPNKIIALLFYEPSSRTMLSFQAAVQGLGAGMILAQGKDGSSLAKGETIEDTIKVVACYSDLIVMRHPDNGSAAAAASVTHVPFVNAGYGGNEHPTQALLDLYTIKKEVGRLEDIHIAFAADPLHSRSIHSLALALSQYKNVRITFISPPSLRVGEERVKALAQAGVTCEETEDFSVGLTADVLYMNRLQQERFKDPAEFEKLRKRYILTADMVKGKNVLVMDPLPRIDEIATDVDALPNAAYFRQVRNGVLVRMALLDLLLGN